MASVARKIKVELGGKVHEFKILPMAKADEWLERADLLTEFEQAIQSEVQKGSQSDLSVVRRKKNEMIRAIAELVFDYDESLNLRENAEDISGTEIAEAFLILKEKTDPFDLLQTRQLEKVQKLMATLPPAVARSVSNLVTPTSQP